MTTMSNLNAILERIAARGTGRAAGDFLLTWTKSRDELEQVLDIAEALRLMREQNIDTRCFGSGLAVSQFRDNSTRTRFSFSSAANLLGLAGQDLDEGKSQIAHGETVRETSVMISFLSDAIGIRDDMYLGAGHEYMVEVAEALDDACTAGVLPQRPAIVNLQCDRDHPTQSMADLQHLVREFGSLENLRGKRIAMTWAYSPSYGKPLSVPQGIIGLMTRLGMDVVLAHPEGYELIPDIVDLAGRQAAESGGSFTQVGTMAEAFADADIVYPKSWAPYQVMGRRTELLRAGDRDGLKTLEQQCLARNAEFRDWECTDELMAATKGGRGLYLHCLPADITGVSCKQGEVTAEVFDRYRDPLYRQAGYKPYIIAAMMLAGRFADPAGLLRQLVGRAAPRVAG
jgi:knotted carbamoyltransferase YgeW